MCIRALFTTGYCASFPHFLYSFYTSLFLSLSLSSITSFSLLTTFHKRYTDDDNRIVLQPLSGSSDCQKDYINASYVDVCAFIILHVYIQKLNGCVCCTKLCWLLSFSILASSQGYEKQHKFIACQGKQLTYMHTILCLCCPLAKVNHIRCNHNIMMKTRMTK